MFIQFFLPFFKKITFTDFLARVTDRNSQIKGKKRNFLVKKGKTRKKRNYVPKKGIPSKKRSTGQPAFVHIFTQTQLGITPKFRHLMQTYGAYACLRTPPPPRKRTQ